MSVRSTVAVGCHGVATDSARSARDAARVALRAASVADRWASRSCRRAVGELACRGAAAPRRVGRALLRRRSTRSPSSAATAAADSAASSAASASARSIAARACCALSSAAGVGAVLRRPSAPAGWRSAPERPPVITVSPPNMPNPVGASSGRTSRPARNSSATRPSADAASSVAAISARWPSLSGRPVSSAAARSPRRIASWRA